MGTQNEHCPTQNLLSYFSAWTRLLKVVPWCQKLWDSLLALTAKRKKRSTNVSTHSSHQKLASQPHIFRSTLGCQFLSMKDLGRAEKAIVSYTQRQDFPNEFEKLKITPHNVQKKVDPLQTRPSDKRWITESRRMTVKGDNVRKHEASHHSSETIPHLLSVTSPYSWKV